MERLRKALEEIRDKTTGECLALSDNDCLTRVARSAALEEAAKVVDEYAAQCAHFAATAESTQDNDIDGARGAASGATSCARRIRALKEKP